MLRKLALTAATSGLLAIAALAPVPANSGVLQLRPSAEAEPGFDLVRRDCVWRRNHEGKMKCFRVYGGGGYGGRYYGSYGYGGPCRWAYNHEGKPKCFPIY